LTQHIFLKYKKVGLTRGAGTRAEAWL